MSDHPSAAIAPPPTGPGGGTGQAAAKPSATPLPAMLMLFSVSTGIIDAVSILGLGNVFTANMTGNVVFLGFAAVGQGGFLPELLAAALIAFLIGATLGGRLANAHRGAAMQRWLLRAVGLEAALILAAAGLVLLLGNSGLRADRMELVALLAMAMGLRNATVRKLGIADMTTTVLTLTLTGLAADSSAAGGKNPNLWRRGGAVVAIFLGACTGAALLGPCGAAVPLALAAVLTFGSVLALRRHAALQGVLS